MTEEKRLRKEQEDAIAAQKAKKNEYNDGKIAVDEAKSSKDALSKEAKKLRKAADDCKPADSEDCKKK